MPTTISTTGGLRDGNANSGEFTVTNFTQDLTLDCTNDNAALANNLGTLIKILIEKGVIAGTVATA